MTSKPLSHHDAEAKNRALWDEIAPVHLKAYKEVALLRGGAEVLNEIELAVAHCGPSSAKGVHLPITLG